MNGRYDLYSIYILEPYRTKEVLVIYAQSVIEFRLELEWRLDSIRQIMYYFLINVGDVPVSVPFSLVRLGKGRQFWLGW